MKEDIDIPEASGVYLAAVREQHEEFKTLDWNAYIINDRNEPLEMVLLVSRGFDEKSTTSTMRHSIKVLPAKSFAKIEFLQEEVLKLSNEFAVTWFADDKMYEKKFVFGKKTIKEASLQPIPVMGKKGVLAK